MYELLAKDVPNPEELVILQNPHPALKSKCTAVTTVGDKLRAVIGRMQELLAEHDGVGLAASQVGISERFCLVKLGGTVEAMINPAITNRSGKPTKSIEGCLSIRGFLAEVLRFPEVTVSYYGLDGKHVSRRLSGLSAVTTQHELDHLDGLTMLDRSKDVFPVQSAVEALSG